MLSSLDDTSLAESLIKGLLRGYTETNDSAFISSTNLSLSKVYTKTNRIEEAYQCIDKALAYAYENDFDNHRLIYDQLIALAQADSLNTVTRDYVDLLYYVEYVSRTSTCMVRNEAAEQMRKKAGELLSVAMNQNESLFLRIKK